MDISVKKMTGNIKPFLKYYRVQVICISVVFMLLMSVCLFFNISKACTKRVEGLMGVTFADTHQIIKDPLEAHPILYEYFYGHDGVIRNDLRKILNGDKYDRLAEKLSVKADSGGSVTLADDIVVDAGIMNGFNNTLVMLGMFIALVTFGYGLFNQILRSGDKAGVTLINSFIHLIICLALVINGRNLMLWTVNIGTELTGKVLVDNDNDYEAVIDEVCENLAKSTLSNTIDEKELKDALNEESDKAIDEDHASENKHWYEKFTLMVIKGISRLLNNTLIYSVYSFEMTIQAIGNCIHVMSEFIIPKLAITIAGWTVSILIYSRSLEILLLCSLAPIAFGFMSENGLSSSVGMRYWKNIIALALQGVVIMAVLSITSGIIIGFLQKEAADPFHSNMFVNSVIMAWVEVAMVKKSLDICHQVVGLR